MKYWIFILTTLIFTFSSTVTAKEKIYHWVDDNGKNHFSDTAESQARTEVINVRNQNLLINPKKQNIIEENQGDEGQEEEEVAAPKVINYQTDITFPKDDTIIRSNDGTLNIQVATTPEKENDDTYQLYLDGKKLGEAQRSTTILALNIDRGTHQIQVHLLDKGGKLLAKTQIVTVHIQRATVNTGKYK